MKTSLMEKLGIIFFSLKHRNYRLLWIGTLVSQSGDWMDQIALNWLVLQMTNSPLSLGLVNLFRAVPILFISPLGGVAADRWQRRKVLMVTQSTAMILAFILGFLVTSGRVRLWEIYLIGTLRGTVMSFNMPARQSYISELVPREDLPNAIALNSATMNLTRILGPSAGGIIIATVGTGWLFYLNAISFLAVLLSLYLMTDIPKGVTTATSGLESLREGINFIRREKFILYLVFLGVVPMFFGQPYMAMLTVYARDVLEIGPTGLGLLTSTVAMGSVVGALFIASKRWEPSATFMLRGMIFFGASLMAFAFSRILGFSLIFLFTLGISNMVYNTSNNSLIQLAVPDVYRGRVVSLLFVNRGLVPLGTALTGWLAEYWGIRWALGGMACVVALIGVAAYFFLPGIGFKEDFRST